MAETLRRSKLLQAITYFATRTTHCGKAKLYWLLYLLDFKVYGASSLPVTGLDYYASADGPVPLALDDERACPGQDFVQQFQVNNLVLSNGCRLLSLHARGPFEPSLFSQLERRDLDLLGRVHADCTADQIREKPFLPAEPWRQAYEMSDREFELIDYRLTLPRREAHLGVPGSAGAHNADPWQAGR